MIMKSSSLSARTLGVMSRRSEMDLADSLMDRAACRKMNKVFRRQVARSRTKGISF